MGSFPRIMRTASRRLCSAAPSALDRYTELLKRRPMATKGITSAAISGVSDVACQLLIEKRDQLDMRRLATFTALGGVVVGPTLHTWFSTLYRLFPGSSSSSIARRLLLDQFAFAPTFIPLFMVTLLTLEGREQPLARVRESWWPAMLVNWKLWIPAQAINFSVVPPHYQVLFANGVALIWNTYFSYLSHHAAPTDPPAATDQVQETGPGRTA